MPGDEESMSDEAVWQTLPVGLLISYSMFNRFPYMITTYCGFTDSYDNPSYLFYE